MVTPTQVQTQEAMEMDVDQDNSRIIMTIKDQLNLFSEPKAKQNEKRRNMESKKHGEQEKEDLSRPPPPR